MKQLIVVIILGLIITFHNSCKKEEENNVSDAKNYFKVGEKKYDLSSGIIYKYGTVLNDEANSYSILLFSDDFTIATSSYSSYIKSGTGELMEILLLSDSKSDTLEEGEYNFSEDEHSGNCYFADCILNYNIEDASYDSIDVMSSGIINIEKDGSNYIFTIDFISMDEDSITGYFKGELTYIDYSYLYNSSSTSTNTN